MRTLPLLAALLLAGSSSAQTTTPRASANPSHGKAATTAKIHWLGWNDEVFAQAKRENKFVLLDLEAVWCHWCHVMDETTYRDPKVAELIRSKYIAVKVNQDS